MLARSVTETRLCTRGQSGELSGVGDVVESLALCGDASAGLGELSIFDLPDFCLDVSADSFAEGFGTIYAFEDLIFSANS